MRVGLVCGALRPELDGVAAYVVRLADELRLLGVDVRIAHAGEGDPPEGRMGDAWSPRTVARAARALRNADVVHVQFAPSMYRFRRGIGLLPAVLRPPLVTTLHEYGWWPWLPGVPGPVWRPLERLRAADRETALLVPASRRVITTNPRHAEVVARRFGGRIRPETVPIGANVAVESPLPRAAAHAAVRAELGLAHDATLLAFFGFVHPVKGVRYLADALARLRREGRDLHLLVVGGFESLALPGAEARAFEAELRAQVAALGVAEHVTVTGFREGPGVSRLLTAADVAVLPFTAGVTTKSGSLLTVMAHGLPTVVTAGDEPDPELEDGRTCVAVDTVRDGAALADGVRRVLDDHHLAARIAAGGAHLAHQRSWRSIAERHLAIYRSVLA